MERNNTPEMRMIIELIDDSTKEKNQLKDNLNQQSFYFILDFDSEYS